MLISATRPDLCLAYVNTRFWRGREPWTETLHDLAGLTDWLGHSASVAPEDLANMPEWSCMPAREAAGLFAEAMVLREAMYCSFAAIAAGRTVREEDFTVLKEALAQAPPRRGLARSGDGYAWCIEPLTASAPDLLAPVLWSVADLMIRGANATIRQCANGECLWLFLDDSKSGTRRWCDMASCGNRAKARRHYLKTKRGSSP
jgi:predicted RNA-binding Zn ribbon-like protein